MYYEKAFISHEVSDINFVEEFALKICHKKGIFSSIIMKQFVGQMKLKLNYKLYYWNGRWILKSAAIRI